nr:protease inhibitor I42 family protein [uncultured Carboxylicivirga sp.]
MKPIFIYFVFLTLIFSGCKSGSNLASKNTPDHYTINVGEEFSINLKSNSTTGYAWQWINSESVEVVDSIDWRYVTLNTNLIGAGGTEKWTFKGMKSGIDSIKMIYSRPWEANSAVDSISIEVNVQ